MVRRVALALTLASLTLTLAAPPGAAQTPKRGGILRIAEREAPSLDPHLSRKFEKMANGPVTPCTEVDDWLYSAYFPEQPNNRSHVADEAYYVYLPNIPQYISHPPYVKGFRHHDGYSMGQRLMYTWLDR